MMNKMKSNNFLNTMSMVFSALIDAKAVASTLNKQGEYIMNNITFNKLDFLGLASGSILLTAFIYATTLV